MDKLTPILGNLRFKLSPEYQVKHENLQNYDGFTEIDMNKKVEFTTDYEESKYF